MSDEFTSSSTFSYQTDGRGNVMFHGAPPDLEMAQSIIRDERRARPANTGDIEDLRERLDRIVALLERAFPGG